MAITPYKAAGSTLFTSNAGVLAGGTLTFYAEGTTTAKNVYPTYADAQAGTNGASVITLDSSGRLINGGGNEIWLNGRYKVVGKDSSGNTLWTVDSIPGDVASTAATPKSYGVGMVASINAVDAVNDLDFTAGTARDAANAADLILAAMTKRADATWAVGTGNGGMQSGLTFALATVYYFWAIGSSALAAADVMISDSATAPTLPTNYDQKVLIGTGKTATGSATWDRVSTINREYQSNVGAFFDTGAADALVVYDPTVTSLQIGTEVWVWVKAANTGATTMNVSSTGAKAVQDAGAALTVGRLGASTLQHFVYNGTAWQCQTPAQRLGTGDSPTFITPTVTSLELNGNTANTLTAAAGVLSIEGHAIPTKDQAATISAIYTFSAGIIFANETMLTYDEGSWTPGVSFGGGTTGITYAVQTGNFTKSGRGVVFSGEVGLSSKGSSTGQARITGLPFTCLTNAFFDWGLPCNVMAHGGGTLSASYTQWVGAVQSNTTTLGLHQLGSGQNVGNITDTLTTNGTYYAVGGTYQASTS